jgi:cytochrome c biogenesis protein CcdA
MVELVLILTPIALIDSTSIVPLSLVPLAVLFTSRRPLAGTTAFLSGLFLSYLVGGIVIYFGLGAVIESVNHVAERIWKHPDTIDLILQIVIGMGLLLVVVRMAMKPSDGTATAQQSSITPAQAFWLAVTLNIVGLPGAVPYFAAIDQMLRADLAPLSTFLAIAYYCLIFVLPLIALVLLRQAVPGLADRVFGSLSRAAETWGRRVILMLLLALGTVMILDGLGWFLGRPLISFGL